MSSTGCATPRQHQAWHNKILEIVSVAGKDPVRARVYASEQRCEKAKRSRAIASRQGHQPRQSQNAKQRCFVPKCKSRKAEKLTTLCQCDVTNACAHRLECEGCARGVACLETRARLRLCRVFCVFLSNFASQQRQ